MDYNISVNVKIKSVIQTNYEFKQQDFGQKLVVIAEDYDVNGTTARLFINKMDGTVNERIMTKENNNYTYTLDAEDTSCAGTIVADVKYYKSGVRDSSASFIFNIIPDRLGKLIENKDFSDSIIKVIERCDQAIANIQEQANQAMQDVENALLAELNIYDGYDNNAVGFAADSRQLNESVPGSYAEMIKNRIGVLSSLTTTEKSNLVKAINELKDKNDTQDENIDKVNNNLDDKISRATEVISSTNANDFKGGVRFGYGDNIVNHPYTSGFIVSMSHAWADAGIQIAYATDFGSAILKPCLRSYLGNTYSPWTYFDGTIKTT